MPAILYSLIAATVWNVPAMSTGGAHVFVLHTEGSGWVIEKLSVPSGKSLTVEAGKDDALKHIILPVGPGGSGSLIRVQDRGVQIVHCTAEGLQVVSKSSRGKTWEGPIRRIEDLHQYDTRVSVTDADENKKAFLISGYGTVREDPVGPVIDMFAGRYPMSKGDYSIYTDTYQSRTGEVLEGTMELDYKRYLFANGELPDGTHGLFAVDLGAGQTVVARAFVPKGIEINRVGTVQYSSAGKEILKYEPSGATGKVRSALGQAILPTLTFGQLAFRGASVVVMPELPDLGGQKIVGILGIDLLQQTRFIAVEYGQVGAENARLRLKNHSVLSGADNVLKVPFSRLSTHLVLNALINKTKVFFYLDTGAPTCFLDQSAASAANVQKEKALGREVRGFDEGAPVLANRAIIDHLSMGGQGFEKVDAMISSLPVFDLVRRNGGHIGLLGNSFLSRFAVVEIDLDQNLIRLKK